MPRYQLAQINVGRIKGPIDSPVMADFVANLERINLLAEQSPGYVWRLQDEAGDATAIETPLGEGIIVNMSVWDDVASLNHYVYKTAHVEIMKRRKEWFERMSEAITVLWWVQHGHRPTVAEAAARLEHLRAIGPSEHAFTFQRHFPAPMDVCPA